MTLSSEARRVNFIPGATAGARMHTVIFFPEKKKCLSCLSRNEVLCLKNKLLIESMNDSTPYGKDMSYYQLEIDAEAIQE